MADGFSPHANATPGKTAAITQTAAASNRKSVVLVTGLWIHGSEREEEEE
jgi:hypothetical protein